MRIYSVLSHRSGKVGLYFTQPLADVGLPSIVEQRPWARDVSHWKPLPVMAVIATRTSSVSQFPCLATDRGRACSTFLCFLPLTRTPACSTFLAMAWQHAPALVVR